VGVEEIGVVIAEPLPAVAAPCGVPVIASLPPHAASSNRHGTNLAVRLPR
jgi:hypothetical protein